ncbi:MAG: glycosyltransferase family 4 protein [Lachnospirales bacterium]
MKEEFLIYLLPFFIAFSVSLLLTPYTKTLSKKFKVLAVPNERSMHSEPKGLLGGVAIFLGFNAGVSLLFFYVPNAAELNTAEFYKEFIGFLIGGLVIFIVGIIDDKYTLKARVKLLFQILVALIVILSGITIDLIQYPISFETQWLNSAITLVWIVGIINAVNIIDGIDGLAAGVSAISAFFMMILCMLSGSTISVVFAASLAGSCLGFLPRNFYPSEIFMGDTGAMFLGYVLSVSSILGVFKGYALLSIVISVLVLAFPIFDVGFAMLRRALAGKPIMSADRGHLHHRIYDAGFSERKTVMILYLISFICALLAVIIALKDVRAVIITVMFIIVLFSMTISYRVKHIQKKHKKAEEELNKTVVTEETTTEFSENEEEN